MDPHTNGLQTCIQTFNVHTFKSLLLYFKCNSSRDTKQPCALLGVLEQDIFKTSISVKLYLECRWNTPSEYFPAGQWVIEVFLSGESLQPPQQYHQTGGWNIKTNLNHFLTIITNRRGKQLRAEMIAKLGQEYHIFGICAGDMSCRGFSSGRIKNWKVETEWG